ncbi:GNAT family N-acetyltransferase [Flavihumibacter solisilvae]|uniref:N-acetyltransferase domain-containing protein n=1 Tax=Flavihumibacter solisilvae TaxID=1349421 RepID=A0A0C1KZD8_9BACT|nr:GNAT family N-acetyltransferase [Flavihumibacter solisilvae]KIC93047.1 hypothetical protein OI18_20115 [Flavihumibacter solisilvae]
MRQTANHTILQRATKAEWEQAAAENHRQLFCSGAIAAGGEVHSEGGITWTYAGPGKAANIAFPDLDPETAGEYMDRAMDFYRRHEAVNVGCWSLDPPTPADIGIRLLARGFQPGWQPCWMVMDLHELTDEELPAGLQIEADNDSDITRVPDLPYADDNAYMSRTLLQSQPEAAQRLIARVDNVIIGQTCLFMTTGPLGIAGIYNVGVIPFKRKRGIGKALVIAACKLARNKGYRYAMLNANHLGRPLYEKVGFQLVGYGATWWLMNSNYISTPAPEELIALTESCGRGDIAAMETAGARLPQTVLNTALNNGMTLLQVAAMYRQPAAAEWLVAHGANFTALDAWDLQWEERATNLLLADPGEVNRRYFEWNGTLLHIAAERNDLRLAQLALSAGADLSIQDTIHHGNALDWAIFFKRPEIISLIREKGQPTARM